jgi:serine/threonine protein kinase
VTQRGAIAPGFAGTPDASAVGMLGATRTSRETAPPRRFDSYEVVRWLGSGGMASVYLARDLGSDRLVALKIASSRRSEQARARLSFEARALATVHHPNVVAAYDTGVLDGQPYIATEYVDGDSLSHVPRPLRWRTVLAIGLGLARGLAAVHDRGLVHRDIKPSNIMLSERGNVKLIDFGLAQAANEPGAVPPTASDVRAWIRLAAGTPEVRVTASGCLVGTPRYLAPELWSGGAATARSDVFAMGLVLHELLAGLLPHTGLDGTELVARIRNHPIRLPIDEIAHVPGPLVELIDRCSRRRPDERPASAAAVRDRLEVIAASAAPLPDLAHLQGPP